MPLSWREATLIADLFALGPKQRHDQPCLRAGRQGSRLLRFAGRAFLRDSGPRALPHSTWNFFFDSRFV
jgi:hypothetical protein